MKKGYGLYNISIKGEGKAPILEQIEAKLIKIEGFTCMLHKEFNSILWQVSEYSTGMCIP